MIKFPSNSLAARLAMALCIYLAVLAVVLVVGGEDASASTLHACKAQGRAVTLAQADAPDYRANLARGESQNMTESQWYALTELHAYARSGEATRQYACTDASGTPVNVWRTVKGRTVASFDGLTWRARVAVTVAGWES